MTVRLMRYLLVSVAALAADVAVFLLSLKVAPPGVAGATGYLFGIGVHWILSSRLVFSAFPAGPQRRQQVVLFTLSAGVGLVLTTAIVTAGEAVGVDPRLAKAVAVIVSFVAVYLLRAHVVFRERASA